MFLSLMQDALWSYKMADHDSSNFIIVVNDVMTNPSMGAFDKLPWVDPAVLTRVSP